LTLAVYGAGTALIEYRLFGVGESFNSKGVIMYFRTKRFEYRTVKRMRSDSQVVTGWQKRKLHTKTWHNLSLNLTKKVNDFRKRVLTAQNRRATMAENVRIQLNRKYNEQTKKTTAWAYKYGVPLDSLIVHNK
jgi:hypothetical protein